MASAARFGGGVGCRCCGGGASVGTIGGATIASAPVLPPTRMLVCKGWLGSGLGLGSGSGIGIGLGLGLGSGSGLRLGLGLWLGLGLGLGSWWCTALRVRRACHECTVAPVSKQLAALRLNTQEAGLPTPVRRRLAPSGLRRGVMSTPDARYARVGGVEDKSRPVLSLASAPDKQECSLHGTYRAAAAIWLSGAQLTPPDANGQRVPLPQVPVQRHLCMTRHMHGTCMVRA